MKGDKNTIIGFVLLGILFIGFFYFNNKQQAQYLKQQQHKKDSLERIAKLNTPVVDSVSVINDSLSADSINRTATAGDFASGATGTETTTTIENEVLIAEFTNKGGQLKNIILKNYTNSVTNKPVELGGDKNTIGYSINTTANQSAQTSNLFFAASPVEKKGDGSQIANFTLSSPDGRKIVHQFVIKPDDYLIDWNISMNGADKLVTQNTIHFNWQTELHQQELNGKYEGDQARINYYSEGEGYDFKRTGSSGRITFEDPTEWIGFKQQFFTQNLLSKGSEFQEESKATMDRVKDTSTHQLFNATADLTMKIPAAATATIPLQLYYGPNDFRILKNYDNGMHQGVDLGSGIYAFVKPINRYIIIPIFDFFSKFISNYGWVIMLLTVMIRLITSPLMFKSYLSSAKMRVLRPELDELKKKFPEQQKYAMEQMNLFREAGVNPMGGCIPALIQLPIFVALYSFFNSAIQLRGEEFLWAKDLSTYDVLFRFPFHIPLLGDHISLFTLLACATMMISSIYSMNVTPTTGMEDNPQMQMMKYMPYIMPIMMLFIFNNQPAALSWYYTVSNIITFLIQLVIMNFIIDHEKILAKINEKRKQPKKKSKFAERIAAMQEQQRKIEEMKKRTQNR